MRRIWLCISLTLIGSLPQLFVVGRLLHQVQDGFGQGSVGQRVGLRVHLWFSLNKTQTIRPDKTQDTCVEMN